MIKVKGRDVTLTGKDAEKLQRAADLEGTTPQKLFVKLLREAIKRDKKREKVERKRK